MLFSISLFKSTSLFFVANSVKKTPLMPLISKKSKTRKLKTIWGKTCGQRILTHFHFTSRNQLLSLYNQIHFEFGSMFVKEHFKRTFILKFHFLTNLNCLIYAFLEFDTYFCVNWKQRYLNKTAFSHPSFEYQMTIEVAVHEGFLTNIEWILKHFTASSLLLFSKCKADLETDNSNLSLI